MAQKKQMSPNSLANLELGNKTLVQFQQKCAKPGCNAVAATKARASKYCKHHGGFKRRLKPKPLTPEKARRREIYERRKELAADIEERYKGVRLNIRSIYGDEVLDRATAAALFEYENGNCTWAEYRTRLRHLDTLQRPHVRNKVSHG